MSERYLLAAIAALAGLIAGGAAALLLDFTYRAVPSGEAGGVVTAPSAGSSRGDDAVPYRPAAHAEASGSAGGSPTPVAGRRRHGSDEHDRLEVAGMFVPARRLVLLSTATALLWGVAALRALDLRHFLLMAAFGAVLLALTATDFERHLLPNRLLYPALLAALALCAAWPGRTPIAGLAGGVTGLALMLVIFLALPGFGFGDVKLAALIGLMLGFPAVIMGLLVGIVLGGIGATGLLLTRRAGLRTAIAYGPYLAGGAILEMLLRR